MEDLPVFIGIVGFAVLVKSAQVAIVRLVRLARHFGVSEFSISFLLAGVAAILPELSIGVSAALSGATAFGVGVVLGSNVADLLLVVGVLAMVGGPLRVSAPTLGRMKYFVLPLSLPPLLLLDGTLSQPDGAILILAFLLYGAFLLSTRPANRLRLRTQIHVGDETLVLALALALVLLGAHAVSTAATEIATGLGLPLVFLGTLVAVGTCLPELSLALQSAQKRKAEVGIGNVFGNVLADCMLTIGLIAVLSPLRPQPLATTLLDAGAAVVAAVLVWSLLRRKQGLTPIAGAGLVLAYIGFLIVQTLLEPIV